MRVEGRAKRWGWVRHSPVGTGSRGMSSGARSGGLGLRWPMSRGCSMAWVPSRGEPSRSLGTLPVGIGKAVHSLIYAGRRPPDQGGRGEKAQGSRGAWVSLRTPGSQLRRNQGTTRPRPAQTAASSPSLRREPGAPASPHVTGNVFMKY